MGYNVGEISEPWLRDMLHGMFQGEPARRYWLTARGAWVASGATNRRGRRADAAGPPVIAEEPAVGPGVGTEPEQPVTDPIQKIAPHRRGQSPPGRRRRRCDRARTRPPATPRPTRALRVKSRRCTPYRRHPHATLTPTDLGRDHRVPDPSLTCLIARPEASCWAGSRPPHHRPYASPVVRRAPDAWSCR